MEGKEKDKTSKRDSRMCWKGYITQKQLFFLSGYSFESMLKSPNSKYSNRGSEMRCLEIEHYQRVQWDEGIWG